jgi:hypothetical protein
VKKEKEYIKVVRRAKRNGKFVFVSAIVHSTEVEVQYPINQWVKPQYGKSFIFKDRRSAEDFIGGSPGYTIRRCLARNVSRLRLMCDNYDCPDRIIQFWKNRQKYPYYKQSCPPGTLHADAVKILPDQT